MNLIDPDLLYKAMLRAHKKGYDVTLNQTENAIMSQFECTEDVMASGYLQTVKWPYLGKIRPNRKVLAHIEKSVQRKNNETDD
jgi:hypothetical protein